MDVPPRQEEAVHQLVDGLLGIVIGTGGEAGIAGGGQHGAVTEDFLYLEQVDTGLDQMRGIAVAQAVG